MYNPSFLHWSYSSGISIMLSYLLWRLVYGRNVHMWLGGSQGPKERPWSE